MQSREVGRDGTVAPGDLFDLNVPDYLKPRTQESINREYVGMFCCRHFTWQELKEKMDREMWARKSSNPFDSAPTAFVRVSVWE